MNLTTSRLSLLTILAFVSIGCGPPAPPLIVATSETNDNVGKPFNWPCLYGAEHNSISSESNLKLDFDENGPPKIWSQPVGDGFSAPVAADGKVLIVSRIADEEVVSCMDQETGEELWQFKYSTDFVSKEEDYNSGPYSTPSIGDGFVVVVGAKGQFHCLDFENGDKIWSRDLFTEFEVHQKEWSVSSSPFLYKDQIIFVLGAQDKGAGIISLDAKTGEDRWTSTSEDYSHATPVVAEMHGKEYLFAMTASGLFCLDPNDGAVHWNVEHRQRAVDAYHLNAVAPAVYENYVCITVGPRVSPGFRCFEIQRDGSYKEPWKNIRLLNSQYNNLVIVGGFLFGFTSVKAGGPEFVCIDLEKGKAAWKAKPELGRGNLLAVEDRLLILGEKGVLACFELNGSQAKELWRTKKPIIEKPCYTSMALSNGLLYARNEKEVVCLSLRNSESNE